jgi:hypothetical protein
MRAWCPRCDAVRPGQTSCPVCGTPLATLEETPARTGEPDAVPAPAAPIEPRAPSRLRVALAVAAVALAGLAFVAGRSGARPAPAPAQPDAAPTTTTPQPGADDRQLGWRDGPRSDLTLTLVSARRTATPEDETVALLTLRVDGLGSAQRVLGLRGLRLLDAGGGAFSSPEERPLGSEAGTPVEPTDDPAVYTLLTGPAPRLGALARVEVDAVLLVRPRSRELQLDTGGGWPAGPPLRAVDLGSRDTVPVPVGPVSEGQELPMRVAAAFVGGGRAVVAVDPAAGQGSFQEGLPLSGELRAGRRVLCARTVLVDRSLLGPATRGLVLDCPAEPTARLTLAVGAGVQAVPVGMTLEQP